jgi:hypothetical protein
MRQVCVALSMMVASFPVRYSPTVSAVPAPPMRVVSLILAVMALLLITLGTVGDNQSLPNSCAIPGSACD